MRGLRAKRVKMVKSHLILLLRKCLRVKPFHLSDRTSPPFIHILFYCAPSYLPLPAGRQG